MFCASDKKTLNYSCAVKEKENASCRKDVIETSKGLLILCIPKLFVIIGYYD
jgi:hypothetical protein